MYRLKPRENPDVNQWWMCDEGRYGYHHVHSPERLTGPRRLETSEHANVEWSEALPAIDAELRKRGSLAAVLSPHLTVEEAYLLAKYVRSIDPKAMIALGPTPIEGTDERFKTGFTIRAEKAPNRRGVEEVVAHFMGRVAKHDDVLAAIGKGTVKAAWFTGGYKKPIWDAAVVDKLGPLVFLIVEDMFMSPLMAKAHYQLPGAAFAEREGSYVNHADRIQSFSWAVRPPAGVRSEGSVYWTLLKMTGLYRARRVLDEVAREILYFHVAAGGVPPVGVDLKSNLLAGAKNGAAASVS